MHIRLYERVSEIFFFTRPISGNKTAFFWPDQLYNIYRVLNTNNSDSFEYKADLVIFYTMNGAGEYRNYNIACFKVNQNNLWKWLFMEMITNSVYW